MVLDLKPFKRPRKLKRRNVKELSGLPGKRNFTALSILLETLDIFKLDAVQKAMKTETYVNELLAHLRIIDVSIINTPRDT